MHGCYMQVMKVKGIQDYKAYIFKKGEIEDDLVKFAFLSTSLKILLVSFYSNDAIHKTPWSYQSSASFSNSFQMDSTLTRKSQWL